MPTSSYTMEKRDINGDNSELARCKDIKENMRNPGLMEDNLVKSKPEKNSAEDPSLRSGTIAAGLVVT